MLIRESSARGAWLATVAGLGAVLLALPLSAFAADVDGSSSATFENPAPIIATTVVTGVGTNTFTWGDGTAFASPPNRLSFAGNLFSSLFETPFKIGTLSYFNGTIAGGTGVNSVDLAVAMNFSNPAIGIVPSVFGLTIISTPNIGTPEENADYVTFGNVTSASAFTIGSTNYYVRITGFSNVIGDGFLPSDPTQFHVLEGGTASADLYGVVTTNPVPEPETYAMLLAGLGLLGFVARRRQRSMSS